MPVDPEAVIKELRSKKGLSRSDAIATGVRTGRLTVKDGEIYAFDVKERMDRLNIKGPPKPAPAPPAASQPLATFNQKQIARHQRRNAPERRVVNDGPAQGTPERRTAKPLEGPVNQPIPVEGPKPSATPARAGQLSAAEQLAAQKALKGVEDVGFAKKVLRKLLGGTYSPALDLMNMEQIRQFMDEGPAPKNSGRKPLPRA